MPLELPQEQRRPTTTTTTTSAKEVARPTSSLVGSMSRPRGVMMLARRRGSSHSRVITYHRPPTAAERAEQQEVAALMAAFPLEEQQEEDDQEDIDDDAPAYPRMRAPRMTIPKRSRSPADDLDAEFEAATRRAMELSRREAEATDEATKKQPQTTPPRMPPAAAAAAASSSSSSSSSSVPRFHECKSEIRRDLSADADGPPAAKRGRWSTAPSIDHHDDDDQIDLTDDADAEGQLLANLDWQRRPPPPTPAN